MMKVYIAGAVSGQPREETERKFEAAEELLKSRNYVVMNPLKVVLNPDCSLRAAMKRLLPALLSCDAILLLRDWRFSEGAQIEASLARYAGMRILNEEDLN